MKLLTEKKEVRDKYLRCRNRKIYMNFYYQYTIPKYVYSLE
jgi:hypothetical protein